MKHLTMTSMLSLATVAFSAFSANAERGSDGALNVLYWQSISIMNPFLSSGFKDNPDNVWSFTTDILMYADSFTGIDPEAFMATRVCDQVPTPANNWGGNNIGRFCDDEYEALVAKLAITAPLADRAEIVKQQNDILVERGGIISLVHRANVSGRATSLLGVEMNAWDSELWNIADWSRAK